MPTPKSPTPETTDKYIEACLSDCEKATNAPDNLARTLEQKLNEALASVESWKVIDKIAAGKIQALVAERDKALAKVNELEQQKKPCYCLGRATIEKVASGEPLQTDLVNFVAADDLFHKNPYEQLSLAHAACAVKDGAIKASFPWPHGGRHSGDCDYLTGADDGQCSCGWNNLVMKAEAYKAKLDSTLTSTPLAAQQMVERMGRMEKVVRLAQTYRNLQAQKAIHAMMSDHRRKDTRESQRDWLQMTARQGKELDEAIKQALSTNPQPAKEE